MTIDGKPVVVGIGEILWDMLPSGKQLGGAPANFAYHARMLGADSYVVSCIGRDILGSEILSKLDSSKVNRTYIQSNPDHSTGTVTVVVDSQGVPSYEIHRDVAWDHIQWDDTLESLAAKTDAVCFGSLAQRSEQSRQTIRRFIESMPQESLKVFDINLRQSFYDGELIRECLSMSNVLKLNDEELPIVSELLRLRCDGEDAIRELVRIYPLQVVALTRGATGSVLCSRTVQTVHNGCMVGVVDTIGAGDSFTAAVAMGLLRCFDIGVINEVANRLAAYVCSNSGAMPRRIPEDIALKFNTL